jgi:hypothetical protein
MVKGLLVNADGLLRGRPAPARETRPALSMLHLLALLLAFGGLYGAAMGTFGGFDAQRLLQMLYSAVKVPLLLLVTFALSLPSFFIFNTLSGLRADFGEAVRAIISGQAGLTVALASFAPFTLLWYASNGGHQSAILFNALMFGAATLAGQIVIRRAYAPLLARDPRHRAMLRLWGIVYGFVGIQMAWILRPFIGNPDRPVTFFREDTWGNAYVIVTQIIRNVLGGG